MKREKKIIRRRRRRKKKRDDDDSININTVVVRGGRQIEKKIEERKNLGGCQSTMFISFMKYLRRFTGEKRNIIIN